MKKIINNNTVSFYDDNNEIMYLDHSYDECIWYFDTDRSIVVKPGDELYSGIDLFMKQSYVFGDEVLKSYKTKDKLVWFSDCYYNPDDSWSIDSVSCLTIERKEDSYVLSCSKKLDEVINRANKSYCIAFSPAGNGKFSRNIETGLTLQDDFVLMIYRPLFEKNKILKK